MKKIFLTLFLMFAGITATYAVIAYNQPITVTQPDGTVLTIRVHGDEFLHWTTCGNSLVAKGADGYWRYATFNADGISSAQGARVQSNMVGDGSKVTPPPAAIEKAKQKRASMNKRSVNKAPSVSKVDGPPLSTGEKHFLILLIEFADKSFSTSIDGYPGEYNAHDHFSNMLNSDNFTYNGASGSVKKYYNDVSFGNFKPVFDVYGPIRVTNSSLYYAMNDDYYTFQAVQEACQELDGEIDFTQYCNEDSQVVDNVFFFFPGNNRAEGGGDDTIWPHAFRLPEPLELDGVYVYKYGCTSEFRGAEGQELAGIGTFCHEFGHVIGLPDFYDIDYGTNGNGFALNSLSLMSSGNYNNEGRTPPYFTYEEKHILGWDEELIPLTAGANTLEKTSTNKTYYNPTSNDGEYYLYESRPCEGWDEYTYAPGMAIYHVDKSDNLLPDGYSAADHWYNWDINSIASHQCMDLVETVCPESAIEYYSQMTFPGHNNVTKFTDATSPAAVSWSGAPTGYNLTDISFNESTGETTFTVQKKIKIVGRVMDTSYEPIPGAEIVVKYISPLGGEVSQVSSSLGGLHMLRLSPQQNGTEYIVSSDSEGYYEVVLSEEGYFSVSAAKEGYVPFYAEVDVSAVTEVIIILPVPAERAAIQLQKYNFISIYRVGYGPNIDQYAGLKYEASELTGCVGYPIQSISFMAYNGGNGTVDKMGVKVYFDNELQCDCECLQIFNTMNTVDISSYDLRIPEDKSVTFVYYLINPSNGFPFSLADVDNPATGGNLIKTGDNLDWEELDANVVISATLFDGIKPFELAGINYIPHKATYKSGDEFPLHVTANYDVITGVWWTVNGEETQEDSITLQPGVYSIRARVTYENGREEIIETKLKVVE